MRAGRLDRKITIQRKTTSSLNSGELVESWGLLGSVLRRSAGIWSPRIGDESFSEPQLVAKQKVEWIIRYSADVADLSPQDRIIYPALSDVSPTDDPQAKEIYEIVSVHEMGRREALRIVTARHPDILT